MIEQSFMLFPTVFVASLAGSLHCVGMCGGILANLSHQSKTEKFLYHLGRMITYVSLGAFSGKLGEVILSKETFKIFYIISMISVLIMILLSYFNWSNLVATFVAKAIKIKSSSFKNFIVGLLTAFLPCGWLYAFAVSAAATKNAVGGSLVMLAFFLGTVPALLGAQIFILNLKRFFSGRSGTVFMVVSVLFGAYSMNAHTKSFKNLNEKINQKKIVKNKDSEVKVLNSDQHHCH
jgi:sulfite exporter TauE/SafE